MVELVDSVDLGSSGIAVQVRVLSPAPDSIWRQCVTNSVAYRAFPLGNDGSDLDCFTAPKKPDGFDPKPSGFFYID